MTTPTTPIREQVADLLDGGYDRAARQVLRAIAREIDTGLIDQRLNELETEAARLEAAGERLRPDNAVLRALLADTEAMMGRNQQRMTDAAPDITESGVEAAAQVAEMLTFAGSEGNPALARVRQQWNRPDPQATAALIDFTLDSAWDDLLAQYGDDVIDRMRLRATFGFSQGWGARRSARAIRLLARGMPASQADNILRTLHLTSYRRGTAATHAANAAILKPTAIRVAVLDERVCLACVRLHGTRVPIGQPVADHWRGRCTVIAEVQGFDRQITPGADWFASLPEDRQRQQRAFAQSPGLYEAYRDGAVALDDFVVETSDPLFGEMVQQASLKGILGEDARKYYRK